MSKIDDAIYEVHYIDNGANSNKFLNKVHPLTKLLITVIYIIALTSIDKYDLITTIAMMIYLIIVSIIGDLSIKNCIKKLKIAIIFIIILGIANPILDRNIIYIGNISIYSGFISMITLILKGIFAIISSYFLIMTTSIDNICYALKIMHIPNILIIIFMLIYRYIIVFLKEIKRIWIAYSIRAPKQKGIHFRAWGSMLGNFLLSSIDKARMVYESMELRGFNPDCIFIKKYDLNMRSILCFIFGILLIVVVRFIPIFEMIGTIFI